MEVILKEDVLNLGYKGEIVIVKNGYGRNYLIPTKKAILATESAKKVLAEDNRQRVHKLEQIRAAAVELSEKLEGVSLTILAKASKTGKIFGAVTNIQLAEALAAKGVDVDRKVIALKEPVKELGSYTCTARLHKEVSVDIPFEVVAEEKEEK